MKSFKVLVAIFFLYSGALFAQEKTAKLEELYSGLSKPTSIYVTQQHIFVVESGKHRVLKLDHYGELIETVGGLGNGDYQFDTPLDIDATNGLKIYVADYRNNRVQVFDRRFQFLTSIRRQQSTGLTRAIRPTQATVNKFGELFYFDESSKTIIGIDEQGNQLYSFPISSEIKSVSDIQSVNRNLYILDLEQQIYHELSDNGLEILSYPLEGATQLFVDKNEIEWLIGGSSIRNSRSPESIANFSDNQDVVDFFKLDNSFFILTENTISKLTIEN
ncbi:MAG: hypothetical protein RLN81_17125 [Balneolaceae bacterium]